MDLYYPIFYISLIFTGKPLPLEITDSVGGDSWEMNVEYTQKISALSSRGMKC